MRKPLCERKGFSTLGHHDLSSNFVCCHQGWKARDQVNVPHCGNSAHHQETTCVPLPHTQAHHLRTVLNLRTVFGRRSPQDRLAFAVHSFFVASGYRTVAVGKKALETIGEQTPIWYLLQRSMMAARALEVVAVYSFGGEPCVATIPTSSQAPTCDLNCACCQSVQSRCRKRTSRDGTIFPTAMPFNTQTKKVSKACSSPVKEYHAAASFEFCSFSPSFCLSSLEKPCVLGELSGFLEVRKRNCGWRCPACLTAEAL